MQAIIRLKGINASFYLPLESLTFLRCLEFFKNRMLRHSAQLNILNGPNFMTTMCNTILVFIAESHKMHISLPRSISKLMKALTSTRCEKKENKRGNQNTTSTQDFLLEWVCDGKKSTCLQMRTKCSVYLKWQNNTTSHRRMEQTASQITWFLFTV